MVEDAGEQPERADYDGAYRALFDHPTMVRDLLEHFVPAELLGPLAFGQMERLPVNFRAESLAGREADMAWRIPAAD